MIVSGPCGDDKTYYWSLISTEGNEISFYEFDGEGSDQTFVALNKLKKLLYMSVYLDNSLHCFGLNGRKCFTFEHPNLIQSQGLALDSDDNVYVVGTQSKNILQLSADGSLIQIIVKDMEKKPNGICFNQNGDKFLLTNIKCPHLSVYALKDCQLSYHVMDPKVITLEVD
ncbi:hypothetical protein CHS0354_016817 [Potamilus streckersoni]|uniref:Uncharacterized protein n=1 Tax=Potamilus streckersoni TaxID=2493646 RepID=A0AAE0W786_9BIVA|nr:hypothetical protein CHS0354_016817 [Potamilus streckersoni]